MPADGHPGTLVIVGAGGLAQQYALGQLHPVNRQRAVEQRLGAVERFLVYQLRPHRRIWLNAIGDGGDVVISDREAEYLFTNEDGYIDITKGTLHPTRNNVVDWALDYDALTTTLLADDGFLDPICDHCSPPTPGLNDLTDVVTSGAAPGDHLRFDGANWVLLTPPAYVSDAESGAYTGQNNAQAGTPYAKLTDLNALRVAYENVRALVEGLL